MSRHGLSVPLVLTISSLLLTPKSNSQITIPATGIISTIAGNGTAGFSGDGGSAINAEINEAFDVAVDGSGNLYICDTGNNRIREINAASGQITTIAGTGTAGYSGDGGPATSATMRSPEGIAVAPNGDLYIADEANARVRKVTASTGIISTVAGTGTPGYSGDGGQATSAEIYRVENIALDVSGNLYLADAAGMRVRKVTVSTGIITTIAGTGSQGYSGDGGPGTSAKLNSPWAVAVDAKGNVYIADSSNYRIREIDASTGNIQTIVGTGTSGDTGDGGSGTSAKIGKINYLSLDAFGHLYLTDVTNNRIRSVDLGTPSNTITTFAGNGQTDNGSNGQATQVGITPAGTAVDGSGNIYIADTNKNVVRAVGAPPESSAFINPRFIIVGVTYAPPGPNSYVQYTNSTMVSNTTSLTSSFNGQSSISVSVGAGISAWGANGKITGTSSTSYAEGTSNTDSVTVSQQTSMLTKTLGTPNSFSPVNHDYDVIWLWLNPLIIYSYNPNSPQSLVWAGYGYDPNDQPAMDVWPVYVGYLNGDFGPLDQEDATVLARSWATNQTWPSGQGPAITSADFSTILGADPFSNVNYVFSIAPYSSPATSADGRFTISGGVNGTATSFDYVQAAPGNGGGITQQYTNSYTNTSTTSQQSTYTFQQGFGIEQQFSSSLFFTTLSYDLKENQTLTWTTQSNQSLTKTSTQTDMLSITGPNCTGSPCNPSYQGPPEFNVYQDNLFGTFMFNPVN